MNPHRSLLSAISIAAAVLATCPGRADDTPDLSGERQLRIRADHLSLDPSGRTIAASGHVRLEVDDLVLESGSALVDTATGDLVLGPPLRLEVGAALVSGSWLVTSGAAALLEIDDPLISIPTAGGWALELSADSAACDRGRCRLTSAVGTGCPHEPPAYVVAADEVTIHPSGDIDLRRAELRVGDTTVAALPWLRVRPAGSAGFLPPRLAWDANGGLILGPAGQLPISDDLLLSGHAAVRTSQGFETSSSAWTPAGNARVDQLFDAPQNHVRARFHLTPPLRGATLVVDGDLVDARQIIDDLTFDPLERARTHTRSAALLTSLGGDWFLAESRIELLQAFDDGGQIDRELHTPTIGVGAELLPVVQVGPIWPSLTFSLSRHETTIDGWAPDAAAGMAPEHTRITASPSLAHASRLGPLAFDLEAASLHQLWLPDLARERRTSRHLAAASAELELPLARDFGDLRHLVSPQVRYRITPWIEGDGPTWVIDDLDRLRRGHGIEAGLGTALGSDGARDAIDLVVIERFDLPGFGREPGPAYLNLSAAVGPHWLRLRGEGSWDHRERPPSNAVLVLSTADDRGNRLETGGAWYGLGRGAHLDRGWDAAGPWIAGQWVAAAEPALELLERATVALTRRIRVSAGAMIGVVPDARLHALWYGLELGAPCGCLAAGILASHRLDSWAPDVMATISLAEI